MIFKIVPQTINHSLLDTVSARDIHSELESGKDYSSWIKARIEQVGFIEGQDYIRVPQTNEGVPIGVQQRIEYFVTLDMAAVMCLIERTPKGHQLIKQLVSHLHSSDLINLFDLLDNLDVKDLPVDRFVYVAKEEFSGRYKVGISKHPEERVQQLNVGNPEHLILVHAYLATEQGNLSEKLAHIALADKHLRSEWFDKDADLSLLPSYVEEK